MRQTIAAVQDAGVPVTIVTGRTLDYVREHVAPLGITTPVVTTQGAVIGDPTTGEIIHETTIPIETARRAVEWIDAQPYITALYFLDPSGRHLYTRTGQGQSRISMTTFSVNLVSSITRYRSWSRVMCTRH